MCECVCGLVGDNEEFLSAVLLNKQENVPHTLILVVAVLVVVCDVQIWGINKITHELEKKKKK